MIPRFKPNYSWAEWKAVLSFWKKDSVNTYEKVFANKFGRKYGVMFSYGRSGLYALLKSWALDDVEVICPAYTCVVVPNAIVLSGNIPVFVDCEDGTFNMNLNGIRDAITDKTRVIIPTHIFGYPMNVEAIKEIVMAAEEKYGHKIYVIQDCAHSFGAKWNGELVTRYGDAVIFGLNISKIINSIFGGMVITDNTKTVSLLRTWRQKNMKNSSIKKSFKRFIYFVAVNFAFSKWLYRFVYWLESKHILDRFVKYYEEDKIDLPNDWDYMPSEIEARVGLAQLERYKDIVESRQRRARVIIKQFSGRDDIFMLPYNEGCTYSHLVGVVENREEWVAKYKKHGIQLGIIIEYSIPSMKAYQKYAKNEYKISDAYSKSCVNFPVTVDFICTI